MTEHRGGAGNFAEDRQKASDAGRKGGQHSGGNFKNRSTKSIRSREKRWSGSAMVAAVNLTLNLSPPTFVNN